MQWKLRESDGEVLIAEVSQSTCYLIFPEVFVGAAGYRRDMGSFSVARYSYPSIFGIRGHHWLADNVETLDEAKDIAESDHHAAMAQPYEPAR
jgi:hypothetical protein